MVYENNFLENSYFMSIQKTLSDKILMYYDKFTDDTYDINCHENIIRHDSSNIKDIDFLDNLIQKLNIKLLNYFCLKSILYQPQPRKAYFHTELTTSLFFLNTCNSKVIVGERKLNAVSNRLVTFDDTKYGITTCSNAKRCYYIELSYKT